jgi:uncharacterized protein
VSLIIDAAPLVALADKKDRAQAEVERLLCSEKGPLVIPAPVSAEVDYLLGLRLGAHSRQAFLEDISAGRFVVSCLEPEDYATLVQLNRKYQSVGLADLSIVVMAHRYKTKRIATFDIRHFRMLRPLQGGAFKLVTEQIMCS